MVFGVPMILAGIGVLNRSQWGRVLTLVLGVFSGIFALLCLLGFNLLGLVAYGGYTALVFVILLNSQYAAEFNKKPY
jgi:hypothetical protein